MRDLDADMATALTQGECTIALLADFEFESETIRMWTGIGELTYDGNTYQGGGNLVAVSPYQETQDLQAQGLKYSLSGVPSTLISIALQESYQGRICNLYLAIIPISNDNILTEDSSYILLEDGSYLLLENAAVLAYRLFSGIMDFMDISDDGQSSTIILSAENILTLLKRNKASRYTKEDQRARFPDDAGLDFISQLQDKEIVW